MMSAFRQTHILPVPESGRLFLRLFLAVMAPLLLAVSVLQGQGFRAAVVKVDITPDKPQMLRGYTPRMSTDVHDRIYHRIVAMDDGKSQFFLVSSDLCSISPAFVDRVTDQLAERLGVGPQNVWWSITHNHSSPYVGSPGVPAIFMPGRFQFPVDEDYTALVEKTLIEGAIAAREKLEPARLGAGWGYANANVNRRARDGDGKVVLGVNPDGAVDRRIGLLRLEKADGGLLALIANYAMHATVLGGKSTVITGDAPGIVADYVEEKTGAAMLYVNGAAGNLAPVYSGAELRHLDRFKVLLGDKIIEANRAIRSTSEKITLKTGMIGVETPARQGLRWPDELKAYARTTGDGESRLILPVRFLNINDDIAIWAAPVELFCEISNEIRERSPFPYTFYYGYTGGTFAYLPTEEEYIAGGYEVTVSPFTASASADLSRSVVRYLQSHRLDP